MSMKPLTFWNKLGYGAGALTENNVQNVVNIMLPLIMFNYMGVSPILLGYVFAISRLWDTITDPLMGYLSDRTRSRFGRRKPYILIGAVLSAFSFWLIWMFPEGKSQMWYFWYLTATCLLYYTSTTLFCVPYISMGYELSSDYNERTRLMGYRSLFVNCGAFILPWMYWFTERSWFDNPLQGMRYLSVISGVIFILFALGPLLLTPTHPSDREEERPTPGNSAPCERVGLMDIFTAFRVKPFMILVAVLGLSVFGLFLVLSFGLNLLIYYGCGGDKEFASRLSGIGGLVSAGSCIAAIPLVNFVAKKIGKSRALMVFLLLGALGNLSILVLITPEMPYLSIIQPILGAVGVSAMWILISAMVSDSCDYDELYNHRRREGIFGAIISWTCKLGYVLCSIGGGYFLVWSGFELELGGEQLPETFLNMRLMMSCIPATGLILAAGMLFFYPLSRERMAQIKEALEKRKIETRKNEIN